MCAIFGSFDKEKFEELATANQYRGDYSWSVTQFVTGAFKHYRDGETVFSSRMRKSLGEFPSITWDRDYFKEYDSTLYKTYWLGHVQAPTTQSKDMHPSCIRQDMLWHNGIIKEYQIKEWQDGYGGLSWDTELLHRHILLGGYLDDVDGTFSCARYDGEQVTLFRNEISPLFYDGDLNISSVQFNESWWETEAGVNYKMDFHNKVLEPLNRFETKENPYWFGEIE